MIRMSRFGRKEKNISSIMHHFKANILKQAEQKKYWL